MRKNTGSCGLFRNQKGIAMILVTIALLVLLAFAALALDIGHLFVVRNELKNAADAGALAGARVLYNDSGTLVNPPVANQVGHDAAVANRSEKVAVEVNWTAGNNTGTDVERGHWSFATGSFTPNNSLAPVDLWGATTAELDANLNLINAVRVRARREAIPADSFFARILGFMNFTLSAQSVAYIGFAGSLQPHEVDQPIAICRQAIIDSQGRYNCNTGRMINSSGGTTTNTAAWSNFSQPCTTANPPSVSPLVCASGNPDVLNYGQGMGTVGGMQDTVYRDLRNCWLNLPSPPMQKDWRGYPIQAWSLTLPVIDCPGNNPGPCSVLVGAVTLNIVWIKQSGADPNWTDIPLQMEDWECPAWVAAGRPTNINALTSAQRQGCFQNFASHFNLHTANDTAVSTLSASDIQKTIFFLPSCEYHQPEGQTGGQNFGVLAKYPKLVQ